MSGLKRSDIRPCAVCGKGLAKGGAIVYRVQVERFFLDPHAIQRQAGLEMQLGVPLAAVMGPDEDLARHIDTQQVLVCGHCVMRPTAALLEHGDDEPEPHGRDE